MNIRAQKLLIPFLALIMVGLTGCGARNLISGPPEPETAVDPPPAPTTTTAAASIVRPARSVETRTLQRLLNELERIDALVLEASRHAEPDARVRFDYQLLRRDMQLIGRGIEAHIQAESQASPDYEPIAGDYRR